MRGWGVRGPHPNTPLPMPRPGCSTSRAGHDGCSRGPTSSWGSLHTEGDKVRKALQLPPHNRCPQVGCPSFGITHRVAARGGRGVGDLGRWAAVSSPPTLPTRTLLIPPHTHTNAIPTLTELPLGLAHGPRTPGPLEQTVVDPGSKPGGTQPPSTHSLTPPACPTCPQSSRCWPRSNQAQMPGQPSNPNPICHSLVFEPEFPHPAVA